VPRSPATPGSPIPPARQTNVSRRQREYLTPEEVEKLLQASGKLGRHGARDRTLILLAYRHGLRVSELVALRWDQVDLKAGLLHVARLKNGLASTHPIRGPELRALRELRRDYPSSPYLFVSELGGPMTPTTVRKLLTRAVRRPNCPSLFIRTCCGTRPATSSRTTARTRARSSNTSGIGRATAKEPEPTNARTCLQSLAQVAEAVTWSGVPRAGRMSA